MIYINDIKRSVLKMDMVYFDIIAIVCALSGVVIGLDQLSPKKPLYATMIVLGVGCIAMGKAYTLARQITGLETSGIFHVGILGAVGAFAFFFSSNFGQVDSLVDDGSKKFLKYRIIPLAAVAAVLAVYGAVLISPAPMAEKLTDALAFLSAAAAGYFHMKHLLIPDVDYGVVRCQRWYNALALALCFGTLGELTATAYSMDILYIVSSVVQSAALVLIVPIMKRGVKKWSK